MGSIINNNKSAKMQVAEVTEKYEIPPGETRYKIIFYKKTFNAIPLVGTPFKVGDKVIILFGDSNVEDTPFIVGKINQKSMEEEKLISKIKPIDSKKDTDSLSYETKDSLIRLDDKRKRITIENKDSKNAKIVLDNDQVIIGDTNLTQLIKDITEKSSTRGSDQLVTSERNLNFKTEDGQFKINAQEFVSLTGNFIIRNSGDMLVETNHVNISASFVEFNAITPKGYDLKEKNAFSFFAVNGNYSISLGTGDFNLKSVSPLSEFNFLISPLVPFNTVGTSLAGINFSKTETLIGHIYGITTLNLKPDLFKTEILTGLSALEINPFSFGVDLLFGAVTMSLTPMSFSVKIGGNKMTLSSSGLTVTSGNITALGGDVKALGGTYSLIKHKHQTAVPGPPSPPLPG